AHDAQIWPYRRRSRLPQRDGHRPWQGTRFSFRPGKTQLLLQHLRCPSPAAVGDPRRSSGPAEESPAEGLLHGRPEPQRSGNAGAPGG
nr:hypothetical protein [Tanacetum cinerariifolium]